MLGFIRRAPNRSTKEFQLLIVPMSSPTISNTIEVRWLGFKNDFIDANSGTINRRAIKRAIEDIVEENKGLFPRLNPRLSEVDFSSLSNFCRTYLLMIKALELN